MKIALNVLLFFSLLISACQSKTKADMKTALNLKDIELAEALVLMKKADVITIDIRTPEEISKGKILNSALEMDYYADGFNNQLEALNKDAEYVIYCRSGGRSGRTLKAMKKMGFKNAYNVLGGYNAYVENHGNTPLE